MPLSLENSLYSFISILLTIPYNHPHCIRSLHSLRAAHRAPPPAPIPFNTLFFPVSPYSLMIAALAAVSAAYPPFFQSWIGYYSSPFP